LVKQKEEVVNWTLAKRGDEMCKMCGEEGCLEYAAQIEESGETVFMKCEGCGCQWRI
jgi:DNA-directed RNA polymerase subunit M/transcription elongation factor TFIIS